MEQGIFIRRLDTGLKIVLRKKESVHPISTLKYIVYDRNLSLYSRGLSQKK